MTAALALTDGRVQNLADLGRGSLSRRVGPGPRTLGVTLSQSLTAPAAASGGKRGGMTVRIANAA